MSLGLPHSLVTASMQPWHSHQGKTKEGMVLPRRPAGVEQGQWVILSHTKVHSTCLVPSSLLTPQQWLSQRFSAEGRDQGGRSAWRPFLVRTSTPSACWSFTTLISRASYAPSPILVIYAFHSSSRSELSQVLL